MIHTYIYIYIQCLVAQSCTNLHRHDPGIPVTIMAAATSSWGFGGGAKRTLVIGGFDIKHVVFWLRRKQFDQPSWYGKKTGMIKKHDMIWYDDLSWSELIWADLLIFLDGSKPFETTNQSVIRCILQFSGMTWRSQVISWTVQWSGFFCIATLVFPFSGHVTAEFLAGYKSTTGSRAHSKALCKATQHEQELQAFLLSVERLFAKW